MGTPTAATVLYDDGTTRHFDDVGAALRLVDEARVELHYQYHVGAVPGPSDERRDLWRYRALLPVDSGPVLYPLAVGGTPLVAPPGLRRTLDLPNLWLKDETRSPTGSNKDRATALVLQQALNEGVETISCASTGNVAVSLAVGAAAAGKSAVVFVPADVAESKLVLMLAAGAVVLRVRGGYTQAVRLSRASAKSFGWCDRNTGINPYTLDAKKTVAFEIWEQLGRRIPDAVVVPVGDGTTLSALAKGFRELVACGVSFEMPRIIGVQAEGCQPVKTAWETNARIGPAFARTIADGIAVGSPISGTMAIRETKQSGGGFVAVSDEEILTAVRFLAARAGMLAEPAAAATIAALQPALSNGLLAQFDNIVALITGSGLKTPRFLATGVSAPEIEPTLQAVRSVLPGTICSD